MQSKIVIGVAGMPGAGKATVEEVFRKKGYPVVVMGDEVREEAKRRNLKPTPDNFGRLMLQIREEEGPAVLAKRCIPNIRTADSDVVVVDGVRSPHEVDEFKKAFRNFILIAIDASPKTRFRRLRFRARSDDPKDWETFIARDKRELNLGLGELIATADYVIVNEGKKGHIISELNRILWRCLESE